MTTIKWTLNGDQHCGYSSWVGETPFGRILITWKDWKEDWDKGTTVDEFPGDFTAYGSPAEVKAQCELEFHRRLQQAVAFQPQQSVATYMGHRNTPEGTMEFWGIAEKRMPRGTDLYAAPVTCQRINAWQVYNSEGDPIFIIQDEDSAMRFMDTGVRVEPLYVLVQPQILDESGS